MAISLGIDSEVMRIERELRDVKKGEHKYFWKILEYNIEDEDKEKKEIEEYIKDFISNYSKYTKSDLKRKLAKMQAKEAILHTSSYVGIGGAGVGFYYIAKAISEGETFPLIMAGLFTTITLVLIGINAKYSVRNTYRAIRNYMDSIKKY